MMWIRVTVLMALMISSAHAQLELQPVESFGTNGSVMLPLDVGVRHTPLALGSFGNGEIRLCVASRPLSEQPYISIASVNELGQITETFGNNGLVTFRRGHKSEAFSALFRNGQAVVAGGQWETVSVASARPAVFRFKTDGEPDSTFGVDGIASGQFFGIEGQAFHSIQMQSNGVIYASGAYSREGQQFIGVVRFLANGTVDASYGDNGVASYAIGTTPGFIVGSILETGNSLVIGYLLREQQAPYRIVRFAEDGTIATEAQGHPLDGYEADDLFGRPRLIRQQTGHYLFCGTQLRNGVRAMRVARLDPVDLTLDPEFADGGYALAFGPSQQGLSTFGAANIGANSWLVSGNVSLSRPSVMVQFNADGRVEKGASSIGIQNISISESENLQAISMMFPWLEAHLLMVGEVRQPTSSSVLVLRYRPVVVSVDEDSPSTPAAIRYDQASHSLVLTELDAASLTVYDLSGALVHRSGVGKGLTVTHPLPSLPSGVYSVVAVTSSGGTESALIMVP